jgi:hypothetical protein
LRFQAPATPHKSTRCLAEKMKKKKLLLFTTVKIAPRLKNKLPVNTNVKVIKLRLIALQTTPESFQFVRPSLVGHAVVRIVRKNFFNTVWQVWILFFLNIIVRFISHCDL